MSTISPAKLAANQANAQKSTGPKSPEGKARVSQNALTHGLFARAIVLEGRDESNGAFQSLLDDLNTQFQPQTPLESLMVQRVATAAWRIQRAHRFESRVITCAHKKSQASLDQIAQVRAKLDQVTAEISECETLLTALDSAPPKNADDKAKKAYVALQDRAAEITAIDYSASERKEIPLDLDIRLEKLERTQKKWSKKLTELEQAVAVNPYSADPESLIADADHLPLLLRYENSLDRQLHRALASLERSRTAHSEPRPSGPGRPMREPWEQEDWFNRQSQIENRQSPDTVPSPLGSRGRPMREPEVGEGYSPAQPPLQCVAPTFQSVQSQPAARATGGTPRPSYPQTPLGNFVTRIPSARVPRIEDLPEYTPRLGPHSARPLPGLPGVSNPSSRVPKTTKQTQLPSTLSRPSAFDWQSPSSATIRVHPWFDKTNPPALDTHAQTVHSNQELLGDPSGLRQFRRGYRTGGEWASCAAVVSMNKRRFFKGAVCAHEPYDRYQAPSGTHHPPAARADRPHAGRNG